MSKSIQGLESFLENTGKLDKYVDAYKDEMLQRVKDYTPVATGKLQAGWTAKVDKSTHEIIIENDATDEQGTYYAPFVENGTVNMRGSFMAARTLAEHDEMARIAKRKAGL